MNLLILKENDRHNDLFKISGDRFEHLKNILNSKTGDTIEVGLLNGNCGTAKLVELSETNAVLKILDLTSPEQQKINIDLICALPRPQTLKKVLSSTAAMGVRNIYLIRSEKVEKSYFHSPLLKEENYTKFLIEGLSQGKRTMLPKVSIHNRFKRFFEEEYKMNEDTAYLLAHPDGNSYLTKQQINNVKNITLAVGPEGGWNDFEVELMVSLGFTKIKISESILRVENAVVAVLAQVELSIQ